jgi:hypothetical protein
MLNQETVMLDSRWHWIWIAAALLFLTGVYALVPNGYLFAPIAL